MHKFLFLLISCCIYLLFPPVFNNGSPVFSQDSIPKNDSAQNSAYKAKEKFLPAGSAAVDSAIPGKDLTAGASLIKENAHKKAGEVVKEDIKKIFRTVFRYFRHCVILLVCCGVIVYTISFYRKKIDNKRFLTSTRLSVMDKEVQVACNYMEKHYGNPDLSVESICEALVTGAAFLEALFERELGMGVSDFILQVRINRAKQILEKKPLEPSDEVALQVGFTDYKLFLNRFKDITGVSFEEYQDSLHPKI